MSETAIVESIPIGWEIVKRLQEIQYARARIENLASIARNSNKNDVRCLALLFDEFADDIFFALVDIDRIHQDGGGPSFMGLDRVTASECIIKKGLKRSDDCGGR